MRWGINKIANRNLRKDVIVTVVCILFYLGLILFMVTPPGGKFFGYIKNCMPFMELVSGTLSDIDRLFGLVFEKIGLGGVPNSVTAELAGITIVSLLLDLCKLMLSSFIQSMIFLGFSFLFLYAGKFDIAKMLIDGEYKDILYYINEGLLLGISILLGGLFGNGLMQIVEGQIAKQAVGTQHLVSIILFIVFYVLFSLYFMIRSRKSQGIAYSFGRSLIKTVVFNVLPEVLVFFVTNVVVVFMFNCFTTLGLHYKSILALLVFILWDIVSEKIKGLMLWIFQRDLPFCGKYCPISGLLWLPTTVTVIILLYAMMVPNMNETLFTVEGTLSMLPFVQEWVRGMPVLDAVMHNFEDYTIVLMNLLVLSTVAALLQYLSSSYWVTLFTQIIGRTFLIGFGFVAIIVVDMLLIFVCNPLIAKIEYPYVATFIAVLLFVLFVVFQPYLALQGVLTTGAMILMLQWIPYHMVWDSSQGTLNLGYYLGGTVLVIVLDLILALLQNVVAYFEKKANIVTKTATALVK